MTTSFKPLNEMNIEQMVQEYYHWDHYTTVEQEKLTTFLKPYAERITAIKAAIHEKLLETGATSMKTQYGTPHFVTRVTPSITDEAGWIDWCMENWDKYGKDLFAVAKPKIDGVREYMQANNDQLPPHITTSSFTSLQIKKS